MAKNKYYPVIKEDKTVDIYNTWDECFPNVNKVKGNIGYKGCKDEKEVIEFIMEKLEIGIEEIVEMFEEGKIKYSKFDISCLKHLNDSDFNIIKKETPKTIRDVLKGYKYPKMFYIFM